MIPFRIETFVMSCVNADTRTWFIMVNRYCFWFTLPNDHGWHTKCKQRGRRVCTL